MLTKQDIEWIKGNRKETTANRTELITIGYESAGEEDPWTGEKMPGERFERIVSAEVTEISSQAGTGVERKVIGGVVVEDGDVWLSINFDLVSDIYKLLTELLYDGDWYSILALDKKGIGEPNRVEVLGRLIT